MTELTDAVDPVDALEALLRDAPTNSQRSLYRVRDALDALGRDANNAVIEALAAEDDPDERDDIVEWRGFFGERMLAAREAFSGHLMACANARGKVDDPGAPACSVCGRFAPIAIRRVDGSGDLLAACEGCRPG
jgi:hypothetical protein